MSIVENNKKKIIFSSYDDISNPFYAGGGAVAINQIATRLAEAFDVTVITGNYKGAKNVKRGNVFYKRIGPAFLGPKLSQLCFYFLLPFYVTKETFDIWVESFTPPFSTACLQLFTKKPVIGLVHMLAGVDMERKYKLPFRFFEEKGLRMYRHFIVLKETTKRKIQRINKQADIFVIPNGVDEVKQFEKQGNNKYILFIGRLECNQKGLDLLLDAYYLIASKIQAKLIIAGSGTAKDEQQIKKRISEYGLENSVELVGKVAGKEKEALLRNCELVVLPSRFETFSLVALEAMSYGKPVVSFAIQGLDWLPSGSCLQVKPFATDQYADAILRVLTDSNLQKKMAAAGRKAALQYSWEKITEAYKDTFAAILQTK